MNNVKIKQSKHFVAFLDILGYSDYIKSSSENEVESFLNTVEEALKAALQDVSNTSEKQSKHILFQPKVKIFSDNILLAIPCKQKNIDNIQVYMNFIMLISNIQQKFLYKYKLLLRGGIARGQFYFSDNFVFGDALIKSYEMESAANYPRIILEPKEIDIILKELNSFKDTNKRTHIYEQMLSLFILKDQENYFINCFFAQPFSTEFSNIKSNNIFDINSKTTTNKNPMVFNDPSITSLLHQCKPVLVGKIQQYGNYNGISSSDEKQQLIRQKVMLKYLWMIDYFNISCKSRTETRNLSISYKLLNDPIVHLPKVEVLD